MMQRKMITLHFAAWSGHTIVVEALVRCECT